MDSGGCLRKFRLEHARPLGCRPIRFASSVHGGDAARVPRTNGTNPRLDSDLLLFALGGRIAVTRGSPVARECLLVVERMLRHPPRVSIRGHHSRLMPNQHVDPARNWAKEETLLLERWKDGQHPKQATVVESAWKIASRDPRDPADGHSTGCTMSRGSVWR